MPDIQKKRDPFLDIIKAIGIVSIVVGHCSVSLPFFGIDIPIGAFVYTYHIMIFLFVPGFLWKPVNGERPSDMIGKTLLTNWKNYVLYSVIFVLLHNLFVQLSMIASGMYDLRMTFTVIIQSLIFNNYEQLLGAFWFVPMYAFAIFLFAVCFSWAEKTKFPLVFHLLFMVGSACVALLMNHWQITLYYHFQTSFLAVPVCYLGYFAKRYFRIIKKCLTWYGCLISAALLFLVIKLNIGTIELSANQIISPYLFYPVTMVGIYFCMSLASLLSKIKYLSSFIAYIGKNSFHIMALHFLSFKLVDLVWGSITNQPPEVLTAFTKSFDFWYVYYIAGTLLPLLVPFLSVYVKKGFSRLLGFLDAKLFPKKDGAPPTDAPAV